MTDDLGATIGEVTARLDDAGIPYIVVGSIGARLDRVYLERQVVALGLATSWTALLASLVEAT
jgi:hypothetical protein